MEPKTPRGQNLIPYLGFFLAIAGIIYQSGQLSNKIEQTADRVTSIEASQKDGVRDNSNLSTRVVRIETKLDFLIANRDNKKRID